MKASRTGYHSYCKPCALKAHRTWSKKNPGKFGLSAWNAWLKKIYGIDKNDYQFLLDKQSGVCAICLQPDSTKRLSVDHCHSSRMIRGLLCGNCNNGLGRFKDNPQLLLNALKYLKDPMNFQGRYGIPINRPPPYKRKV